MKLGKLLYVKERIAWRKWLEKNHDKEKEIWLIYYRKITGKPRIEYNEAVEEALCFGWIDSIEKGIDKERFAQRFSPRKHKSSWSEANKERLRKLIKEGKATSAGIKVAPKDLYEKFSVPADILKELKKEKAVWRNFQKFPENYKRIRIAWIDSSRKRPAEFRKRLKYFLEMTSKNNRFGMIQ